MKKIIYFILAVLMALTAVSCSRGERPVVLVVFGATGDLTAKKILPAIDQLGEQGRLPEQFAVVGVARKTEAEFRKQVGREIYYNQAQFDEDEGYDRLEKLIGRIEKGFGAKSDRIYFLATQPSYFAKIVERLAHHNLLEGSRVVIEKPFGHDLKSAMALQESIARHLDEEQIYLVDHYLGKEGLRNLVALRQSGELEPVWNREHIDHVEIVLSEEIGIGTRGQFWEETGLLRDVVQNHVMQMLSLVAMERPEEGIPEAKIEVMKAMRLVPSEVVRAQYGPGVIQGSNVVGYVEEKGVPKNSKVETYVAAKITIDNERWRGVPFEIKAGKRLAEQKTEIVVSFKSGKELHIRIQPKPAVFLKGEPEMRFEPFPFSEAYQKLIYDCMRGDRSSFVQNEEQLAAWRLLTPVLEHWKTQDQIETYPAGINLTTTKDTESTEKL
ncbi:MAG TPA: glucose-6-phosphate dehydrogenase [Chlamydiales bacterium]|nr:glucose-6-phosphate dehydrogenase [Chlamydiales bacterium]